MIALQSAPEMVRNLKVRPCAEWQGRQSINELKSCSWESSLVSASEWNDSERIAEMSREEASCLISKKVLQLGPVTIISSKSSAQRIVATHQQAQQESANKLLILVPLRGSIEVNESVSSVRVEPSQFIILSSALHFQARHAISLSNEHYEEIVVEIPVALFRGYVPDVDSICRHLIGVHQGAGSIMMSIIETLLANGHLLSEEQSKAFGTMIVEAVAINVANAGLPAASQRAVAYLAIRQRAERFAEANLSDAQLSVTQIAKHCSVSVRYLYMAFAEFDGSPVAFIRLRRLEQCRVALQNEKLRHLHIGQIARQWGFERVDTFSRSYMNHFGISARAERQCAFVKTRPSSGIPISNMRLNSTRS